MRPHPTDLANHDLVLQGRGAAPGSACGPMWGNAASGEPPAEPGGILVARHLPPQDLDRLLRATGTLTLGSALLSHAGRLSRELGKPSVVLGARARVRLVDAGGTGLLSLDDRPAPDGSATVLDEGDLVWLDGDRGVARVPGGIDRQARAAARRIHATLARYAAAPEDAARLAQLQQEFERAGSADRELVLRAALELPLVPAGEPRRQLVRRLSGGSGAAETRQRLDRIGTRVREAGVRRLTLGLRMLERIEDPDELERHHRLARRTAESQRELLVDLACPARPLEAALEALDAGATSRRQASSPGRQRQRPRGAAAAPHGPAASCLVLPLDARGAGRPSLVGNKAAGLIEAAGSLPDGCRVPQGFVLTTSAYLQHLGPETAELLRYAFRCEGVVERIAAAADAAILERPLPRPVVQAIREALDRLDADLLAVRSSSTLGDGAAGSLAGQFDSFLGVRGESMLLDRVQRCWASLWNPRALRLLRDTGQPGFDGGQAALVQRMVPTRAAGTLFTDLPECRPDTLLVNAAWGLGRGISSGRVGGDLFWVKRSSGELLGVESEKSRVKLVVDPAGHGTTLAEVSAAELRAPCLGESELARLARLAGRLLERNGRTQEVEFGFGADDTLYVFQLRPVPALASGCASQPQSI